MKLSLSIKSTLLSASVLLSSCATTKYSDNPSQNNYYNLKTGAPYSLGLRDGKSQKMIFQRISNDSILGFTSKNDSTIVAVHKNNVATAKNLRASTMGTAAIAIGLAGAAAIAVSSSRATSN